jgi:hypothetical protein
VKKLLILLVAGLLLACTCSSPSLILPSMTATQLASPDGTLEPLKTAGFTIVQLHSRDGDLAGQLHNEAPKAAALGQHMFVEFDASW